jgi:hypothetical protein
MLLASAFAKETCQKTRIKNSTPKKYNIIHSSFDKDF